MATIYDEVVVGGGPVGWASAYELAKAGHSVLVLEQNCFFNQAGSSGDLARMFRTMYTEGFMADLAHDSLDLWKKLERDAGCSLRSMSGLLNFGDPKYGEGGPEGTLMGPVKNLDRLKMPYTKYTAKEIEELYPFKNLKEDWIGLFAPDNGVINVQLLLRTLSRLALDYGAKSRQYTEVKSIGPSESGWVANAVCEGEKLEFHGKKIILTCGAYVNHILDPSFAFNLKLDIWEMVANYFSVNPGPNGTVFPSMWFQFAPNDKDNRSQLFYGFPAVEWGPPNVARIAVDAATQRIADPRDRKTNEINANDIRDTQDFVRDHVVGVDWTVPAFSLSCLQTNVSDNMFVLDFIPEKYMHGARKDSVIIFTAGWAMKFVPLLGKAIREMAIDGTSKYARKEFSITRKDEHGNGIIVDDINEIRAASSFAGQEQGKGSSFRRAFAS